jgi:hypothetical protein
MNPQRSFSWFGTCASALVLCSSFTFAQAASDAPPQKTDPFQVNVAKPEPKQPVVLPDRKLTPQGKMEIIRGMTAELGYARKPFPFGKTGVTIKDGKIINPTEEQMSDIMASYGAAIKAGDVAHITDVKFKDKALIFDINGGPQRKQKWYQHIQVGMGGGDLSPGQPTDDTNIHGSLIELRFDKFVPEITPAQIKQLLDPMLNFSAKSATEAYLDTIPPKAKTAITEHKALVGMDRDMVTYALGRPPQKYRDKDSEGVEYEEWIYGTPPQQVQFVRFVGNEVVRIETMQVNGTKAVRTAREITIQPTQPEVAQQTSPGGAQPAPNQPSASGQPQAQPTATGGDPAANRPTLRRPGEDSGQQPDLGGRPQYPGANIPDTGTDPGQPPQ